MIDTGVWIYHPDLVNNVDSTLSVDLVNDYDSDVGEFRNHGTKVAGIISADMNNSSGVASVAGGWNSSSGIKLMCLAVGNSDSTFERDCVSDAFEHAISNGADVINCSWRYGTNYQDIEEQVESCYSNDVVVVGAIGNEHNDTPTYPAWNDHVIGVGFCFSTGKAYDSNYGNGLDVVAPSGNSLGPGATAVFTTTNNLDPNYNVYGGYYWGCGSSCAAPQVSGLAALLLSYDPSLSVDEITEIICESTVKYDNYSFDDWGGAPYGAWDDSLGYGRINAYRALLMLKGYGELATDVTWHNDIELKGDITIPDGNTLTLSDDITVSFPNNKKLSVNGTLVVGSDAVFTTATGATQWSGIQVGSTGTSELTDSMTIEYASIGFKTYSSDGDLWGTGVSNIRNWAVSDFLCK